MTFAAQIQDFTRCCQATARSIVCAIVPDVAAAAGDAVASKIEAASVAAPVLRGDSWRDRRENAGVGDSGRNAPRCRDTGAHAAYQLTTPGAVATATAATAAAAAAAAMAQDVTVTSSERDILVDDIPACRVPCTPDTGNGLRPYIADPEAVQR